MDRRRHNGDTTPTPVNTDAKKDRELFDAMPKRVRLALIEAKYDYNSEMIWEAFRKVKKDLDADDYEAWGYVIQMIPMNDRDAAAKERQMYQQLVVELSDERRERIERAFQKAS